MTVRNASPGSVSDSRRAMLTHRIADYKVGLEKFAGMFTGNFGVRLVFRGTVARTEGSTITVPELSLLDRPSMTEAEIQEALEVLRHTRGFVYHEGAHIIFTRMTGALNGRITRTGGVKFKFLCNILEDARVERAVGAVYPGARETLRESNVFLMDAILAKMQDEDVDAYIQLLYSFMLLSGMAGDGRAHPLWPALDLAVRQRAKPFRALIERAVTASSTTAMVDIAEEIWAHLKEKTEPTPPAEKSPKSKQEPQKPNHEDYTPPADRDSPKSEEEEEEDDDDDGDDEDEDEDDGDADESSDEEDEGDDEDADDGGADDDEDGDDEDDGSDDADDDGESGDDDGGDEDDDAGDADADDDDAGDDDGEEDDDEGDDDGDDGDDDGSGDDDEDGDDGDGDGDEGDGDDDDDDGDDDADGDSDEDGGSGVESPDFDLEAKPEEGKPPEAPEDLRSLLTETMTEHADAARGDRVYRVYSTAEDKIGVPREPEAAEKAVRQVFAHDLDEQTRQIYGPLVERFNGLLRARTLDYTVRGLDSGELDPSMLHNLAIAHHTTDPHVRAQAQHVFQQRVPGLALTATAVALSVDRSGSMAGVRDRLAMMCTNIIASALEGVRVPFMASTWNNRGTNHYARATQAERDLYNRWSALTIDVIKGFNETWTTVRDRLILLRGTSCNVDGESIWWQAQQLLARPEPRKVMWVLCDGEPSGSSGDNERMLAQHLHEIVARIRAHGIELRCIGINAPEAGAYYAKNWSSVRSAGRSPDRPYVDPYFVNITDPTTLPPVLVHQLETALLNT